MPTYKYESKNAAGKVFINSATITPKIHIEVEKLTKKAGAESNDYHRMQVWAGQSAAKAAPIPAGELVKRIWDEARALL